MKLVDSEVHHKEDDTGRALSTPPRPRRRRVYTSLLVTLTVLAGTVGIIYGVFPKRDNEILTSVIEAHDEDEDWELSKPSRDEISGWSVGVLGRRVPWPGATPELEIIGARTLSILKRPATLVRYRLGEDRISLVALRPRDAVRRKHRRHENGLYARVWRKGKITFAIVGPKSSLSRWRQLFGVP